MKRLTFSIDINAPREKVWDTMLGEDTYPQWTEVFAEGSHFEGDWEQDSKIVFLAPDDSGNMDGMVSRVKENRPHEFISIEHLGEVQDGKEDTSGDWSGALENYTFREKDGKTEVLVEMDSEEEYEEMFRNMWPKALQRLKGLSESR